MEKENPFKKIGHPQIEAPNELKKKVMDGIAGVKLVSDLATLFTLNQASILTSIFKKKNTN